MAETQQIEPWMDSGEHTTMSRFGRLPSLDHRDAAHPMRTISRKQVQTIRRKHWFTHKPLDQGATPHCVAYSGQQFLYANPVKNQPYKDPAALYKRCQQLDEWPGEDYDGTSVRALFKVLQEDGFVSEYTWAFSIEQVVSHVLGIGPVVLGTDWYNGMMDIDCCGFVHLDGPILGGHAYVVKGADLDKKCYDRSVGALRCVNSWGAEWGESGYFWLSFNDAQKLLSRWGEAATAKEMKPKPETAKTPK